MKQTGILSTPEGRRKFLEHQEALRFSKSEFQEEYELDCRDRVNDMNSYNRSSY